MPHTSSMQAACTTLLSAHKQLLYNSLHCTCARPAAPSLTTNSCKLQRHILARCSSLHVRTLLFGSDSPALHRLWLCDQPATVYAVQAAIWLVITCVVQVCVMDSRAYASLTPGMETAEELDACTLLVNSQVCAYNALILCIQHTCDIQSCACHVLQSILCISYCSAVPLCTPPSSATTLTDVHCCGETNVQQV